MTVSQLLANTTAADLNEWMALYRMEHEDRQGGANSDTEDNLRRIFGKPNG